MARKGLEEMQYRLVDSSGEEPPPPDHWPINEGLVLKVDCWRRSPWLPQEVGQGIKETANGKTLQCYITPEGKMYYHRKDMEKAMGIAFSNVDHPPMDGLGRLIEWVGAPVTDEDKLTVKLEAPAHWPPEVVVDTGKRVSWLPADWGSGFKPTSTGKSIKVYVSPEGTIRFHKDKIQKEWFDDQPFPELNLETNGRGDPIVGTKGISGGFWRLLSDGDSGGNSAAKRQRVGEKLQKDTAAKDSREGFSVSGFDTSWVVVPDDVISVDLDRLASKIQGAGWVAIETGACSRLFSSLLGGRETKLALKLAGQMEVQGGAERDVIGLAKLYVDEWLWEDN